MRTQEERQDLDDRREERRREWLTEAMEDEMIKKRGSKYIVTTENGRVLGTHATKAEAQAQLRAVEASKHARKRGKK